MQAKALGIDSGFRARGDYSFRFMDSERLVFRPKEKLTVSETAERYRVVTKGPAKGPWKNSYSPYGIEPMDCLSLPWVRKVYLCFAPQTVKTQIALNFICHSITQDEDDIMYVGPDEKSVLRKSAGTILPMLHGSPKIAEYLSPRSDDTISRRVRFKNGKELHMGWATSAAVLASESIPYMIFDETDKYPDHLGEEADPISLGEVRATGFPDTCKLLYMSTPTILNGYIWRLMLEEADEIRDYFAVCPHCGQAQIMVFDNIKWPADVHDPRHVLRKRLARYSCERCGLLWDDNLRNRAVLAGFWKARKQVERAQAVAFHLPGWYSHNVSLSKCAADFLRGQNDREKLRAFVTQIKAEAWEDRIVTKKESKVLSFKTPEALGLTEGVVPAEAVALTAGIDMQQTGFWFVVRAWILDGFHLNSHLVQYGRLSGWEDLELQVFGTRYRVEGSENKTMGIWRAALDTGGGKNSDGDGIDWSRTSEAYNWLRLNGQGVVWGTKGSSHKMIKNVQVSVIDKMPGAGGKKIAGGLELHFIKTDSFKDRLHGYLDTEEGQPIRWTLHSATDVDYARQLLAEEKKMDRKGKTEWVAVRKDNHLLDCEILAMAAADVDWNPSLVLIAQAQARAAQKSGQQAPAQAVQSSFLRSGR